MSVSLFHSRRAERFAELLDGASGSRRHHARSADDDQLKHLVGITNRVTNLPLSVEAHPEFREGLRAMLMATIEREGIGTAAVAAAESDDDDFATTAARLEARRSRRRARALGTMVTGLAAAIIAWSGMSTASEDSAPGDPLYGFKRSTERAQLALSGSDIGRGQLYLEFAKTRFDEARTVKDDPARFQKVMSDMDQETKDGVRLLTALAMDRRDGEGLDVIDEFVAGQRQAVERLRKDLPAANQPSAETSANLLRRVSGRSEGLRPLLACGAGATGETDDLGPTPRLDCTGGQPVGKGVSNQRGSTPDRSPAPSATAVTPEVSRPAGTPQPDSPVTSVDPSLPANDSLTGELHGNPCDVVGCLPS